LWHFRERLQALGEKAVTVELPAFADPGLETLLIANSIEISAKSIGEGNPLLNLLYSFASALGIIGVYVRLSRRAAKQGGGVGGMLGGGMGKSTACRFERPALVLCERDPSDRAPRLY
jgi:cell division protease FtsH